MSLDSSIKRLSDLARNNCIYIFMLAAIIAINLIFSAFAPYKEKEELSVEKKISRTILRKQMLTDERRVREILEKKKALATVLTASVFLVALALAIGLVLSIRCLTLKLSGRDFMAAYGAVPEINWHLRDALRIVIIFYFFGYTLQLSELIGFWLLGIKKPDGHIMSVINTAIMDILGLFAVLYFVVKKYKRNLIDLGISFKNLLRDVKIGIVGYITALPVLSLVLLFVLIVMQFIRYEPPSYPIFELFYEETRPRLLFFLTILVAFLGPIAEEVFFRGFAYPVFRRKMGVRNAIILVSSVFALLHMNLVGFLPIMVLGVLLAYLYEKTGSLIPSIVVHMIHNLIIVYFVHLTKIFMLPTTGMF